MTAAMSHPDTAAVILAHRAGRGLPDSRTQIADIAIIRLSAVAPDIPPSGPGSTTPATPPNTAEHRAIALTG